MIRELIKEGSGMIIVGLSHELANQLGITHNSVEWAASAFALKLGPLFKRVAADPPCRGCPA